MPKTVRLVLASVWACRPGSRVSRYKEIATQGALQRHCAEPQAPRRALDQIANSVAVKRFRARMTALSGRRVLAAAASVGNGFGAGRCSRRKRVLRWCHLGAHGEDNGGDSGQELFRQHTASVNIVLPGCGTHLARHL